MKRVAFKSYKKWKVLSKLDWLIKKNVLNYFISNNSKLASNSLIDSEVKTYCKKKLSSHSKNKVFISELKKMCIVSGKGRSVYRIGLSRVKVRELQSMGLILGLKKFYW